MHIAEIITKHFGDSSINFLNLNQIRVRLIAINAISGEENFDKAFQTFNSELQEILKLLLTNDPGKVKLALKAKQIVITAPVALTIIVGDFLEATHFKKAFKPKSQELLRSIQQTFEKLPTLQTAATESQEAKNLLMKAKADLDNLIPVESKILKLLEQLDQDMQTLYQTPYSYLFKGLFRAVCAPCAMDTNGKEFKTFTRKILRGPIPLNSFFLLGTYKNSKAIIDQLDAMISTPMQMLREFTLKEDKDDNSLPEIAARKHAICTAFNTEFASVINELVPLRLESRWGARLPAFSGQQQVITPRNGTEISLVTNKKVLRRHVRESASMELHKDCTVICKEMNKNDLPDTAKICKVTLINDDDYLLTNAELSYKIAYLYHLINIAQHIFQTTPTYLRAVSPTLSKSDLHSHFVDALNDKSDFEKELIEFENIMQNEVISFVDDKNWLKLREKSILLSLSSLQEELALLDEGNQEAILKLYGKLANYLRELEISVLRFRDYKEKYEASISQASRIKEQFDTFPQNKQTVEVKLAALKEDFTKLQQEKKWLDRSRQPLTEIAADIDFLDTKLKLITESFQQCPGPINCHDLQQQNVVMAKIRLEFNTLNVKIKEVTSLIEGQKILLANSDLTDQKGYAANSSRFNYSAGSSQPATRDSKDEKKDLPARVRP
jgi:hypothetical protein